MDFGIGYFPTADAVGPGELAAFVEERGFESLVFAEHTHIPASRESPYPGGGDLPRKYTATLDLFVALTASAVATTRLRVGSGIALVIQRDPIITAKETASIDVLSGGRFEFGVGAGWNREEMSNHGTDPRTRMRLFAERVEAVKTIWTEQEATFHGEFVNFDRIFCEPKPVQRPHPPLWVGGWRRNMLEITAEVGDGWIPWNRTVDFWAQAMGRIRERASELGRANDITYGTGLIVLPEAQADAGVSQAHSDQPALTIKTIGEWSERFADVGCELLMLMILPDPRDATAVLHQVAEELM